MPIIELNTVLDCAIEKAFDLARSIDLHERSTAQTGERAVEGKTSGLLELDETVTWEATHFGILQRLKVKITEYTRPSHFRDSMVSGVFASFDHDHFFEESDGRTIMRDVFDYRSPLGLFGRIADILFLEKYMTQFLQKRNTLIKEVAESLSEDIENQRDNNSIHSDPSGG